MYFNGSEIKLITRDNVSRLPNVIYKYRTWSKKKHRTLLTKGEIHFSAPDQLDKYTENIIKTDFSSVSEIKVLEYCLNRAWEKFVNGEIAFSSLVNTTRTIYSQNNIHDINVRPLKERLNRERRNKTISIFCASEISDNEQLWNSFANQKRGYCIGIDFTEIYLSNEVFGTCGRVEYYNEKTPPLIPALTLDDSDGVNMILKVIYNLPDKFKEEREFRLIKLHMKNRTITLKPEWIKEIILGSEISDNDEKEIISIAKAKYPHAKIKRLFVEPTFGYLTSIDYKLK